MQLINTERLTGITAGLAFSLKHTREEINAEISSLSGLSKNNDTIKGKVYAMSWSLSNTEEDITSKYNESLEALSQRKIGRTHTEALSQ